MCSRSATERVAKSRTWMSCSLKRYTVTLQGMYRMLFMMLVTDCQLLSGQGGMHLSSTLASVHLWDSVKEACSP